MHMSVLSRRVAGYSGGALEGCYNGTRAGFSGGTLELGIYIGSECRNCYISTRGWHQRWYAGMFYIGSSGRTGYIGARGRHQRRYAGIYSTSALNAGSLSCTAMLNSEQLSLLLIRSASPSD